MKKLLLLAVFTLTSISGFSQDVLEAVNKTDCPVLFAFKAYDTSICSSDYDFEFVVPAHSSISHTAQPNYVFNAAKAVQLNNTQTCQGGAMAVSPDPSCVSCTGMYPSDTATGFNGTSCTCDEIVYMQWFTPCTGSTYNNAQVIVYH